MILRLVLLTAVVKSKIKHQIDFFDEIIAFYEQQVN